MVDLDGAGRVQHREQLLREDVLDRVLPGTCSSELRYRLGRPNNVMGIMRGASVSAWR